jgi:bifunctional non-homologous end joining protein LigD
MKSALRPYLEKRNFDVTSEPTGGKATRGALSFVIQKHAATRLHYDFRLELDGTLKSWAVPKGPSLDPGDKRMAVHVEDHPLDYASFEGTIPKGQYGAGQVIVWDNGTWEPVGDARAGLRAGKLKFRLHGKKLHGGWTLVRMHGREGERQEPWLLIKERDDEARPASEYDVTVAEPKSVLSDRTIADKATASPRAAAADDSKQKTPARRAARKTATKRARSTASDDDGEPRHASPTSHRVTAPSLPAGAVRARLPATLLPQLATLVGEAPHDAGWIWEIKFDGYRLLARVDGDDVRLFTAAATTGPSGCPRSSMRCARSASARPGSTARSSSTAPTAFPTSTRCRTRSSRRASPTSSTTCSTCRTGTATTCAPSRWSSAVRCSLRCSNVPRRRSGSASARTSIRAPKSCCRTPAGCASRE